VKRNEKNVVKKGQKGLDQKREPACRKDIRKEGKKMEPVVKEAEGASKKGGGTGKV